MIPVSDASMGWYDTYSDIMPRVTSIRGIVRWWFRALVGGVLYDHNLNEIDGTLELQQKIFGSNERASLITFKTKEWNYEEAAREETMRIRILLMRINTLIKTKKYGKIPQQLKRLEDDLKGRVRKLYEDEYKDKIRKLGRITNRNIEKFRSYIESIKEEILKILLTRFNIKLELYSSQLLNEVSFYEKIAVLSTLLSIELGSFGKMARRGHGSFIIDYKKTHSELESIQNIINECKNKDLGERIKYIINLARTEVSKFFNLQKERYKDNLPAFPCISRNTVNGVQIYSIWQKKITNLNDLQEMFLRTKSLAKELRKNYSAWYLGLPRSQRKTGYMSRTLEDLRRPSPLWVKLSSDNYAIISHFVSRDWPSDILWRGRREQKITVDKGEILRTAGFVNNFLRNNRWNILNVF